MGRWGHLRAGVLAVALVACADQRAASRLVERAPEAHAAVAPEAPPPELAQLDWRGRSTELFGSRVDSSDFGIGVVTVRRPAPEAPRPTRPDTLYFRREPRADAPPVAAFVLADDTVRRVLDTWLLGPAGARPNVVWLSEIEIAIPVDSLAGGWARGIVGWDTTGARVVGWADVSDTARLWSLRWAEHLRTRAMFFLRDHSPSLFSSLADTLAPGQPLPSPDRDNYTFEPLETHGRWMRVRLRHPTRICDDGAAADSTPLREWETWIPYLDPRGRPLVWLPTHGC